MAARPKPKPRKRILKRRVSLPPGKYVDDAGKVTDLGLKAVTIAAAAGWPQMKIANAMGMTFSVMKRHLSADDPTLRLAWEKGRGDLEFEISSALFEAAKDGQVIAQLFALKNMGWSDQPAVQTNNGITLILPGTLSREDYLKSIQQPLPQLEVIPNE